MEQFEVDLQEEGKGLLLGINYGVINTLSVILPSKLRIRSLRVKKNRSQKRTNAHANGAQIYVYVCLKLLFLFS